MGSIIVEIEDKQRTPRRGEQFITYRDDGPVIVTNEHEFKNKEEFMQVIVKRVIEEKSTEQEVREDYTNGEVYPYQWMDEEDNPNITREYPEVITDHEKMWEIMYNANEHKTMREIVEEVEKFEKEQEQQSKVPPEDRANKIKPKRKNPMDNWR